jgi:hypothetical protein
MNERDIELRDQATLFDHDAINLAMFAELIRADEREACALICDEHSDDPVYCGAAIRARGNT